MIDGLSDEDDELEFLSDDEAPSAGKKKKKDNSSVFAAAEEFAALLDEEGTSGGKGGTSSAVSNKDKASKFWIEVRLNGFWSYCLMTLGLKQLNWEANRDRWIKGFNRAVTGKRPFKGKGGPTKKKKLKKN